MSNHVGHQGEVQCIHEYWLARQVETALGERERYETALKKIAEEGMIGFERNIAKRALTEKPQTCATPPDIQIGTMQHVLGAYQDGCVCEPCEMMRSHMMGR